MKLFMALVLPTAFLLSGCDDYTLPQRIVLTAADQVLENDLEGFRATLTENALQEFGNATQMLELKHKINGLILTMTEPVLLNKDGSLFESHSTYSVSAIGTNPAHALGTTINATVVCKTVGHQGYTGNWLEDTTCLISEIILR